MKRKVKTIGIATANNTAPYLVSIKVSFGPAFSAKPLTNKAFIHRLRTEGAKHSKSFLGQMMNHFADHVNAAIAHHAIMETHQADTNPNTTYYGQGSCTGCPGDDGSGADCCLCSYNGQNTGCENCNG